MTAPGERGTIGPGSDLDGFVIEGVAGRGGMGVVYRARQRQPDRTVALKVISDHLGTDPKFRARFERESSIAAQIEHPNVIPVYAIGEAEGILYIAMRFVEGTDMRSLIAGTRMDPQRAATIVDQVARALDAAHAHGLVHRDVKPANVLIASEGGRDHAYLSDFGLSRHMDGSQELTGTGAFLGTIDYVAPEQAKGERVDARTDVYSLGCVLFQALTGTVPFPHDNDLAKLYAHGSAPPPSALERVPELPAAFDRVLQRAMAKEPDDRYLSAGDFGRAALAAAGGESLSRAERTVGVGAAAPAREAETEERMLAASTVVDPPSAPGSRRGLLAGAALAVIAAIVLVVVLAGSGGGDDGNTAKPVASDPTKTPAAGATTGIAPGRSIGAAVLGDSPATMTAALTKLGYKASSSGTNERHFESNKGLYVVGFFNNRANYIQIYGDTAIKIDGVSINSTVTEAHAKLPDWKVLKCPDNTLVVSPDGFTYFLLPKSPTVRAPLAGSGINIGVDPVRSC